MSELERALLAMGFGFHDPRPRGGGGGGGAAALLCPDFSLFSLSIGPTWTNWHEDKSEFMSGPVAEWL